MIKAVVLKHFQESGNILLNNRKRLIIENLSFSQDESENEDKYASKHDGEYGQRNETESRRTTYNF